MSHASKPAATPKGKTRGGEARRTSPKGDKRAIPSRRATDSKCANSGKNSFSDPARAKEAHPSHLRPPNPDKPLPHLTILGNDGQSKGNAPALDSRTPQECLRSRAGKRNNLTRSTLARACQKVSVAHTCFDRWLPNTMQTQHAARMDVGCAVDEM